MKTSKFFIATQKEVPAEAEIVSHRLMLRAGLIRRLAAGIYTWLPLGLRVVRKVEAIVREEMNRAGAVELSMPVVQPGGAVAGVGPLAGLRARAAALQGPPRARLRDPADLRGGDHRPRARRAEELPPAAGALLPDPDQVPRRAPAALRRHARPRVRDEGRLLLPRRATTTCSASTATCTTPTRASSRASACKFRAVAADTGAIGGTGSHEFHVLADSGEDAIAFSPAVRLRRQRGAGRGARPGRKAQAAHEAHEESPDAGQDHLRGRRRAARACRCRGRSRRSRADDDGDAGPARPAAAARRPRPERDQGCRRCIGALPLRDARRKSPSVLGCQPGYIGPVGAAGRRRIIADRTVAAMSDFVCGANEEGFHLDRRQLRPRPAPSRKVADIRNVVDGDPEPRRQGHARDRARHRGRPHLPAAHQVFRGDEGHLPRRREASPSPSRWAATASASRASSRAAIEQNHDERGIVFPAPIAPFEVCLVPIGYRKSPAVRAAADKLYARARWRPASTCCSTTATSAPACCSPTWT